MFVRWDGEGRGIGIVFSIVYNSSETLKDNPVPFMMGKRGHGIMSYAFHYCMHISPENTKESKIIERTIERVMWNFFSGQF